MIMEELSWRKSTRCGTTSCVEVAHAADATRVRDSKPDNDGTVLAFSPEGWSAFVLGVRRDRFRRSH